MDAKTAKQVLQKVAALKGLPGLVQRGINAVTPATGSDVALSTQLQAMQNAEAKSEAAKTIARMLFTAGGLGLAARGYAGLTEYPSSKKRRTERVVEMPVVYPEKTADNDKATSPYGLSYYIPSMLVGAPLAFYGGWKGVDAILNKRRKAEADAELEDAKADYEKSLLGAYKQSAAQMLDAVFEKCSFDPVSTPLNYLSDAFPNVPGAAKGLGLSYALLTAPLAYSVVDRAMRKNSKKELMRLALKERARRQAKMQPPELYAIPTPIGAE